MVSKFQTMARVIKYILEHPSNKGQRLKALRRSIGWQLYKKMTRRTYDLKVFGDIYVRCYADSASAGGVVYTGGLFDFHEMKFIQRYLRAGDGFIDVGANIGVYTLLASSIVGMDGRVESFEPGMKALERLRENVFLNRLDQVHLHAMAVGEESGNVLFTQDDEDSCNRVVSQNSAQSSKCTNVPCVRLDDVLSEHPYAMGKIDVEGSELRVLKGAKKMLACSNPPVWLVEINGTDVTDSDCTAENLFSLLNGFGYDLAWYNAFAHQLDFIQRPGRLGGNLLAVSMSERNSTLKRLSSFKNLTVNMASQTVSR
jgi:FkbM family methyltransferase